MLLRLGAVLLMAVLDGTGDLRADMDGNCSLNVLDFNGFLNAFAAGCP